MTQINIWDDLTPSGRENVRIGNLLRFQGKKGITELRVLSKNMKKQSIMVKEVRTFTPEELDGSVRYVEEEV